ncbi:contractile injection system protein, VgrG/Pvc8 family [Methylobacterium sp. WCS2018Hpa-22]|uniref:contractile injection system protein, VgrG/Pvc8 family n=1 Tax=Methylobacterium sp. WCS2018Hpa-22 TaxID=3073633 RepID=UPI00288B1087|nr:contractile injection system protein, VgrG/Pvc8 family [Methylobacterium sp. WCS2018Hpa-22]
MTPAARIVLDGRDITANLIPAPFGLPLEGGGSVLTRGFLSGGPLLGLTVTDNEGIKSDAAELRLDNRRQIPAPKKGAKMQIWLGYAETGLVYMGNYEVESWTKSGRPRTLLVSAKAAGLTTEIKSPKSRSYHDKTVGEIVEQIAGKNGLTSIVHPTLKSFKIGHIDQSTESDINFLTRLAKRVGGNFKVADRRLIMNLAGSGSLPSGGAAPVFPCYEIGESDWTATGSERGSYKSASAAWQNTETGERESVVKGSGTPRFRDRKLYKTQEEAERAAEAQLSALTRGKVSFSDTRPGWPEIFAGARLDVIDHDPDVDGLFNLKTVAHSIDSAGYKTSLTAESVGSEGGSEGSGGSDE